MAWSYSQHSGAIESPTGDFIGRGYSGREEGLNTPAQQWHPNIGPIPQGTYTIGSQFTHALAGPVTMRLTPMPETNTFGRDGFMIHGDTKEHTIRPTPQNSASHGCLVANRSIRQAISSSHDRILTVIA